MRRPIYYLCDITMWTLSYYLFTSFTYLLACLLQTESPWSSASACGTASEQSGRPSTATAEDGSILDELVSWRRLKAASVVSLQRYREFVCCNYFGDDRPTDSLQRTGNADETSTADQFYDLAAAAVSAVGGNMTRQQSADGARLLRRPRAEQRLIASSHSSLSSDKQ